MSGTCPTPNSQFQETGSGALQLSPSAQAQGSGSPSTSVAPETHRYIRGTAGPKHLAPRPVNLPEPLHPTWGSKTGVLVPSVQPCHTRLTEYHMIIGAHN